MSKAIIGSDLTRAMLKNGHDNIWCAVEDSCDKEAMENLCNNDFTAYIVSFDEGCFHCTGGMDWAYAVPIKIIAMTASDARIKAPMNIS